MLISCPPSVRLAKYLQEELETDNDELLYQSARKLFITEFQTIVYKEFLPLLLGKRFMGIYKLDIGKELRGICYISIIKENKINLLNKKVF